MPSGQIKLYKKGRKELMPCQLTVSMFVLYCWKKSTVIFVNAHWIWKSELLLLFYHAFYNRNSNNCNFYKNRLNSSVLLKEYKTWTELELTIHVKPIRTIDCTMIEVLWHFLQGASERFNNIAWTLLVQITFQMFFNN